MFFLTPSCQSCLVLPGGKDAGLPEAQGPSPGVHSMLMSCSAPSPEPEYSDRGGRGPLSAACAYGAGGEWTEAHRACSCKRFTLVFCQASLWSPGGPRPLRQLGEAASPANLWFRAFKGPQTLCESAGSPLPRPGCIHTVLLPGSGVH